MSHVADRPGDHGAAPPDPHTLSVRPPRGDRRRSEAGCVGGRRRVGVRRRAAPGGLRGLLRLLGPHLVAVGILCVPLVSSAAAQDVGANAVAGAWQGVFHVYPDFIRLEVDLAPSVSGEVTGEVYLRTMEGQRRNALGGLEGRARLQGTWDPVARAVRVRAVEWIQDHRQPGFRLELLGVYDAGRDRLGGRVAGSGGASSPFFVLARPGEAADRIFEEARDAADAEHVRLPGGTIGRAIGGLFGGGDDADLSGWADQLVSEYPDLDLRNTTIGSIYDRARSIFADEYFEPFFGKPFDELGDRERSGYRDRLREMSRGGDEYADAYGVLHYGFGATGTTTVMDMTLSVLAQRVIRAWRDDLGRRLTEVTEKDVNLDDLRGIESAADEQLALLWPSEQRAFRDTYEAARARVALPILVAGRDDILAAAGGVDGILAIDRWRAANDEPLAWISDEDRTRLLAPLDRRRAELQTEAAAEVRSSLAGIPRDASGLEAGARWYRALRAVEAQLEPAEVRRLESEFRAVRAAQLEAVAPGLIPRIRSARSYAELGTVLRPSSLLEEDWTFPSMTPVAEAVAERQERFELLEVLNTTEEALLAERARSAGLEEPTDEEMYYAVRTRFGIGNALMALVDRNCRTQGARTDPVSAMGCLVQWLGTGDTVPLRTEITGFGKEGCAPVSSGGGFLCDFRMSMRQNTPLFDGPMGALLEAMMAVEVVRGHFQESLAGWSYEPVGRE